MAYYANGAPAIPGAYIINQWFGTFPVFCSMSKVSSFKYEGNGTNGMDDAFWVLPGYKLSIHTSENMGDPSPQVINNTDGTTIKYVTSANANSCRSFKLEYKGTEISSSTVTT